MNNKEISCFNCAHRHVCRHFDPRGGGVVLHCQVIDYLLSAWPRWSLLRPADSEPLPGDTPLAEVHRICDKLLEEMNK